jgi:hypothetical protein
MVEEKESEKLCPFCDRGKVKEQIIYDKDELWYALTPLDPHIFGHVLVTYSNGGKNCIHDMWKKVDGGWEANRKIREIRESMLEGVRFMSDKMMHIDNVERIYFAMLGEDLSVHMHYHLFPRYGFLSSNELEKWSEKYKLSGGEFEWRRFYATPTMNFEYSTGFCYLCEIARKYDDMKKRIGNNPPKELLNEMTEKLKEILNV